MSIQLLLSKLDAALAYAKAQDITSMETLLEDVRDRSYEIMPRQSAFLIRTACSAVEHVASAFDPLSSAQSALAAIARAKDATLSCGDDLNAA